MISACTSTPGWAAERGVATKSRRPTALVPIRTMLPLSLSPKVADFVGSRMSAAEIRARLGRPEK